MNSFEIRYAAFELTMYATLSTLLTEMALSKDDDGQRWLETFRNSLTSQIMSFSSLKGAGEHAQEIAKIASGSAKQIVNGATQGYERRTAQ